ncbi:MAG: hypothetical protein AAFZ09_16845, partial [Pseudomonadota bacterium]
MIVASQGVVTLRDLTGTNLDAVVGSLLCPGDRLRTGSDGAVELRITGSNSTIGAHNDSILVIAELTAAEGPDITLVDGLLRFISSVEGYFEVGTPFAYAGIDGTEAVIVVDAAAEQALFLVREGDVETGVRGGPDPLMLAAGQAAFVSADEPLRLATADDVPARFRPLLLDPANPAVLFFAGNRVYRSPNRGINWGAISPDLTGGDPVPDDGYTFGTITALSVAPTTANVIYAGTDDGRVWRTVDGGGAWTQSADSDLPSRWVTSLRVDPTDA